MLNSGHIQKKIQSSKKLRELAPDLNKPKEITDRLYLTILSRHPTEEEVETVLAYGKIAVIPPSFPGKKTPKDIKTKMLFKQRLWKINQEKSQNWTDVTWALINSPEFLYRH